MPLPTPDSVARLAGGVCTSAQFVAAGVSAHRLRVAVDAGVLVRVRRGCYAVPDAPDDALTAVRAGGRLAGLSAASSFGLWGGWAVPLHVVLPSNAPRVRGRVAHVTRGQWNVDGRHVVVHWNDDQLDTTWSWRVDARRCIAQVLRWHDVETACAVIDTALSVKIIGPDELAALTSGPTAHAADSVVRCRPGSDSGVESIVRQRLERLGLAIRQQVPIAGVGHVDLGVVGTRVYIEVDGYEFHKSPAQFATDRRRDAEARSRGYVPLRFTAVQVRDNWPWVERMVLDTIGRSVR